MTHPNFKRIVAFLIITVLFHQLANIVQAKADTIITVAPIATELEEGCEYQKYYAEYEQGSWERENAYANQMAGIYKIICEENEKKQIRLQNSTCSCWERNKESLTLPPLRSAASRSSMVCAQAA